MKNLKKIISVLLVVVFALTMATAGFAANGTNSDNGSITIENAVAGQTYTVYQILALESYDTEAKAYAYKATTAWNDFINSADIKDVYVAIDAQGYVTWKDGADAAAFAKAAQAYAKAHSIAASAEAITATDTTVKFENLNLGYYLVDTTLGTLCSLDTTNPYVVMKEKNQAPTVTKEVQEDSNNAWSETNDADINQVVNYRATITVQAGAENYILHDTMSAGLTFDANSVAVSVDGQTVNAANYTVTTTGLTDGCTFEVAFNNDYIATLDAGTQIVVSYSATLNENAVVGLDGNTNEVKLQYGDENQPTCTPGDTTTTYTWDAKIIKFTTKDDKEVMLAGATFKLSADEAGANVLKFHALGENKYQVCADADCTKAHVTQITTDSTGTFAIEGLDSGTYYLIETVAPAGYNMLAGPVTVAINGAAKGEGGTLTYTTLETKVENKSGAELPDTGGMGTTVFYIVGGVLVVGAIIVLITRKRMHMN